MKRLAVISVLLLGTTSQPLWAEGPVASDPIGPEEPIVIGPPIELNIEEPEETPANTQTTAPAPRPEHPSAPSPTAPTQTQVQGLPVGQYLQLAFFRSPDSVERFKRQVADKPWATEITVWFDEAATGHRVLLGPFAGAELTRQRQVLRAEGYETFRYQAAP